MTGLDHQALERIHAMAASRLERYERKKSIAPLMDAMKKSVENLMTNVVPDIMAGPEARIRTSVLNMERMLNEFPGKAQETENEVQRALASARTKTAALRRWLEEVS